MAIIVTNKYKPQPFEPGLTTVINCMRGSALGNPFKMVNSNDRDRVCNNFDAWLPAVLEDTTGEYATKQQAIHTLLNQIVDAANAGHVHLECCCKPKRCHCDTIKTYVEDNYDISNTLEKINE